MDRVRAARSVTRRSQGADPIPGPRTFDSAPVLGTPQAASVPGANDFAPVTGTPDAARALEDPDAARALGGPSTASAPATPDAAPALGDPDAASAPGRRGVSARAAPEMPSVGSPGGDPDGQVRGRAAGDPGGREEAGSGGVVPGDHSPGSGAGDGEVSEAALLGGLELAGVLSEGAGTRTWRAHESTSREEFTVTFAVAEDPVLRRDLEAHFAELVAAWSENPHPHLVSVRATLEQDGRVAGLVTDHVRGTTLAQRAREAGRITPEEIAPVLAAAARGLGHLHEHGWVHGGLSAEHVIVTAEGQVLLDGYGVRPGRSGFPAAWGHGDRSTAPGLVDGDPEGAPDRTGGTAGGPASGAQDVYALGVLGWRALTGRMPGPDSHRVPLTLMVPSAPRHLVLMLEAALADDPSVRPTAGELAAGFAAPAPRPAPARRPQERMTPEIIRADGTVVRPRRRFSARASESEGGDVARRRESGAARDRRRSTTRTGTIRSGRSVRGLERRADTAGGAASALGHGDARAGWMGRAGSHPRVLAMVAAASLATLLACGYAAWTGSDGAGVDPEAAASSAAVPGPVAAADPGRAAGAAGAVPGTSAGPDAQPTSSGSAGHEPAEGRTGRTARESADGDGADGGPAERTGREGGTTHSEAPGARVQDKEREAREAVTQLVSARAAALAAGDEAAVSAVYVPDSALAAKDRDLIRRAAAQPAPGTGGTPLSGLSMEVESLEEEERVPGGRLTPAEEARTRTFRAEIVTRGWDGAVPTQAHVRRDGARARQAVRVTVVWTPEGWRLVDVAPLPSR